MICLNKQVTDTISPRFPPLFPMPWINYLFSLTKVTVPIYIAGSVIGLLPGIFMDVYLGSLMTGLAEVLHAGRVHAWFISLIALVHRCLVAVTQHGTSGSRSASHSRPHCSSDTR